MNTNPNGKFMLGLGVLCGVLAYVTWQSQTESDRLIAQLEAAEEQLASAANSSETTATPDIATTITRFEDAEHRAPSSNKASIRTLATGANAFVGYLEISGGAGVPEHRDTSEEYIHVLEGSGTISIDDVSYDIRSGDTVFMPANAKVSFVNGEDTMRAIQVFSGTESAAKYDSWPMREPEAPVAQ